jgi:branched-subunit amino acid ABC-type transport system permease component
MSSTELVQGVLDGIAAGSLFAIMGVGLGLIVGVTGRFHFAFATTFIAPIYFATSFVDAGVPNYLAILFGIIGGAVLGVAMEILLYRPLADRAPQAALLAIFVTSLGLVTVCESLIRLIWGSESKTLSPGFNPELVSFGGNVGLNSLQLMWIGVSAVLVFLVTLYLAKSRLGRAVRAVKDNPRMAASVGISPRRVYTLVFAIGSALAGVAGALFTMRGAALPDAGTIPTFTAFVVIFLAGLDGGVLRFAVAALAVGILQSVCAVAIDPKWSPVAIFGVLFIYIALSPAREKGKLRIPRRRAVAAHLGD